MEVKNKLCALSSLGLLRVGSADLRTSQSSAADVPLECAERNRSDNLPEFP